MDDFDRSVFRQEDSPQDPVDLGGKSGAFFLPAHGLTSDEGDFSVANLRFVRLNYFQWDMIEKLWVRDLYGDFYRARPKWYCLFPFDSDPEMSEAEVQQLTGKFLAEFEQFVLAARLVQPGVLVDAHHTVHVARVAGVNLRTVGVGRYRLYTAAFGEPIVLPAKSRALGGHAVLLPPRVIEPNWLDYPVTKDIIPAIERMLTLYKHCLAIGADGTIGVVLRNFTVGHDVFLHRRQRLLCLITALEACFGLFNRPGKKPMLGHRVAGAFELFRGSAGDIEDRVENDLRDVRNALAHGSDDRKSLDFAGAEELLDDALRTGLPPLMGLALKMESGSGGPSKVSAASPMDIFQQLLDSAEKGDKEAAQRLVQI